MSKNLQLVCREAAVAMQEAEVMQQLAKLHKLQSRNLDIRDSLEAARASAEIAHASLQSRCQSIFYPFSAPCSCCAAARAYVFGHQFFLQAETFLFHLPDAPTRMVILYMCQYAAR